MPTEGLISGFALRVERRSRSGRIADTTSRPVAIPRCFGPGQEHKPHEHALESAGIASSVTIDARVMALICPPCGIGVEPAVVSVNVAAIPEVTR